MESTGREKNRFIILALLAAVGLLVPGIVAVAPVGHGSGPIATGPDFNLSSVDLVNSTIPVKYQVTPEPVHVEVSISDTLIPGPKGEMQAGPRAIGFAADPVVLLVLAVAIPAGAGGVWYLARRKPEEPEDSAEEDEK